MTNAMYAVRIAEVGHPGDRVKTVHEGIFISYGLRSFGLTFRTSRFARQVPQLTALALHTAGFTAQALQFAQSWFGLQRLIV